MMNDNLTAPPAPPAVPTRPEPKRGLGPNAPQFGPEELVGALHDRGDGPPPATPAGALAGELYAAAAAVLGQSAEGSRAAWDRLSEDGPTRRRWLAAAECARAQWDALAAQLAEAEAALEEIEGMWDTTSDAPAEMAANMAITAHNALNRLGGAPDA